MSFWLRESKSMLMLRALPRWWRWGLTIALGCGGFLFWYQFDYRPLHVDSDQNRRHIADFSGRNAFLCQQLLKKPLIDARKKELEHALQSLVDGSRCDCSTVVDGLLDALESHHIVCKEIKPLPSVGEQFWHRYDFMLTIKGSFNNIHAFIDTYFKASGFVFCNQCTFVRWKDKEIKGVLRVSFIVFDE